MSINPITVFLSIFILKSVKLSGKGRDCNVRMIWKDLTGDLVGILGRLQIGDCRLRILLEWGCGGDLGWGVSIFLPCIINLPGDGCHKITSPFLPFLLTDTKHLIYA